MTEYLASGVEAVAGIIIAVAALQATIRAVFVFLQRSQSEIKPEHPSTEDIRLRLGRWLALSLEFELGADILRTAIAPTWSEIGQLAAIATIRTLLNYFLQQEIDRAAKRQQGTMTPEQQSAAQNAPISAAEQPAEPSRDGMARMTGMINRVRKSS